MPGKVGGVWDLENSPVENPQEIAEQLKDILERAFPGSSVEFHVFFAKGGLLNQFQRAACRNVAGFHVHEISKPPGQDKKEKDTADFALMSHLFSFAATNKDTPLLMLIGGDKDCTKSMLTLKKMDFNVVQTSKNTTAKILRGVCKWVTWESLFAGTASLTKTNTTSTSVFQTHSLRLPYPKDTPAVGAFIDLNSLKISNSEHIALVQRVMAYTHTLGGALWDFRAYGNKIHFPANCPNYYEDQTVMHKYIITTDAKHDRLENHLLAGIGGFVVHCSQNSKFIVVITKNIRLSTTIKCFADSGYRIVLVTTEDGKLLKETVGDKVFRCLDWEDLPRNV